MRVHRRLAGIALLAAVSTAVTATGVAHAEPVVPAPIGPALEEFVQSHDGRMLVKRGIAERAALVQQVVADTGQQPVRPPTAEEVTAVSIAAIDILLANPGAVVDAVARDQRLSPDAAAELRSVVTAPDFAEHLDQSRSRMAQPEVQAELASLIAAEPDAFVQVPVNFAASGPNPFKLAEFAVKQFGYTLAAGLTIAVACTVGTPLGCAAVVVTAGGAYIAATQANYSDAQLYILNSSTTTATAAITCANAVSCVGQGMYSGPGAFVAEGTCFTFSRFTNSLTYSFFVCAEASLTPVANTLVQQHRWTANGFGGSPATCATVATVDTSVEYAFSSEPGDATATTSKPIGTNCTVRPPL